MNKGAPPNWSEGGGTGSRHSSQSSVTQATPTGDQAENTETSKWHYMVQLSSCLYEVNTRCSIRVHAFCVALTCMYKYKCDCNTYLLPPPPYSPSLCLLTPFLAPPPLPPSPSPPFPSQENLLDRHEFLRWLVERIEEVKPSDTAQLQLYIPLVLKVRVWSPSPTSCWVPLLYLSSSQPLLITCLVPPPPTCLVPTPHPVWSPSTSSLVHVWFPFHLQNAKQHPWSGCYISSFSSSPPSPPPLFPSAPQGPRPLCLSCTPPGHILVSSAARTLRDR